jgi:hypothetical protein
MWGHELSLSEKAQVVVRSAMGVGLPQVMVAGGLGAAPVVEVWLAMAPHPGMVPFWYWSDQLRSLPFSWPADALILIELNPLPSTTPQSLSALGNYDSSKVKNHLRPARCESRSPLFFDCFREGNGDHGEYDRAYGWGPGWTEGFKLRSLGALFAGLPTIAA